MECCADIETLSVDAGTPEGDQMEASVQFPDEMVVLVAAEAETVKITANV